VLVEWVDPKAKKIKTNIGRRLRLAGYGALEHASLDWKVDVVDVVGVVDMAGMVGVRRRDNKK
jgi:hypothetical protein